MYEKRKTPQDKPEFLSWILKHQVVIPSIHILHDVKHASRTNEFTITGLLKRLETTKDTLR